VAALKLTVYRPRWGQNLVELAFVLPVCLWILLGIVDFGRVYFFYTAATNAAREGARYWASNPSASFSTIQSRVQAESTPDDHNRDQDTVLGLLCGPVPGQRPVQLFGAHPFHRAGNRQHDDDDDPGRDARPEIVLGGTLPRAPALPQVTTASAGQARRAPAVGYRSGEAKARPRSRGPAALIT
jgi:hypothetical protein